MSEYKCNMCKDTGAYLFDNSKGAEYWIICYHNILSENFKIIDSKLTYIDNQETTRMRKPEYKDLLCMNCQHLVEKSEWLQFNNANIRKSTIEYYHFISIFSVCIRTCHATFVEDFSKQEAAQARFDEIDKLIRGE